MFKALVLSGPTGVGKSRVALALAQRLNGELISADSMQVYRTLDIGTDKPSSHARGLIPHHLIDVSSIQQQFTAGEFVALARERVAEVARRGKVPIVVGGTPYYLHVLVNGLATAAPTDAATLSVVAEELKGLEWPAALALLHAQDPVYATSLQRNDWRRLERAMCIMRATGEPMAAVRQASAVVAAAAAPSLVPSDFDFRCVALTADRTILFRSIDERAEEIVANGLVEETIRQLLAPDAKPNASVLRALGYKQSMTYLDEFWLGKRWTSAQSHRHALVQLVRHYQAATRQFARRQMTWYRASERYTWVEATDLHDPTAAADGPALAAILDRLAGIYQAAVPQPPADAEATRRRATADRASVALAQHAAYVSAPLTRFAATADIDAKIADIRGSLNATLQRDGDWRTTTTPPEDAEDATEAARSRENYYSDRGGERKGKRQARGKTSI